MICFRDMTFCSAECGNLTCYRNFTPDQKALADEWWQGFHRPNEAPSVAFANYRDTDRCPGWEPPK